MRMSRRMALYSISQSIKTLNDSSWDEIYQAGANNTASSMWAVGDCKAVALSGTVGGFTFNDTYYCFIIDFNHYDKNNTTYGIDFQFGKSALTSGIDIAFIDQWYDKALSLGFVMNTDNINNGGWASSEMCTVYCAQFLSILPSDLKNVIGRTTKYTDNIGGGTNNYSSVTSSINKIWLLSEYEVFGKVSQANTNESALQKQYTYYQSGSRWIKCDPQSFAYIDWWLRSPTSNNVYGFCIVGSGGLVAHATATYSLGFSPCFSTRQSTIDF